MRDLLLFLHQIQTLLNRRVVLVLVFAHLEQHLDHVLTSFRDGALVQNRSESFEDRVVGLWRVLCEEQADLLHETHGDFDRVVGGSFQAEKQDLECDNLVGDELVDQVRDEC